MSNLMIGLSTMSHMKHPLVWELKGKKRPANHYQWNESLEKRLSLKSNALSH
jgi:hypothetical protein